MLTDRKVKIQPPELGSQQVGQVSDFFPYCYENAFVCNSKYLCFCRFFYYYFEYGSADKIRLTLLDPRTAWHSRFARGYLKAEQCELDA